MRRAGRGCCGWRRGSSGARRRCRSGWRGACSARARRAREMAGIRADNLTDVNARGTETSGAATRSGARAAVSWLLALARDLSPFGAPAPPPRSRWWRWSVWACALVVLGLGTLDLDQHYQLSPGASLALSAARALPILLCLERPLAGWWLELAASVLTALLANPVSSSEPWPWPVTSVLAQVAADALRGRDETRRRLLEQEQISDEERARRVLLEERARIARELHDVVAHHMSLVAIQAEAAPYRVADPPPELTASFASIRENALQALAELRRVLGVLRAERNIEETAPQPMLDGLGDLVAGVRRAGLEVETVVSGTPRPLPPGVELSAYRIVQEALSNVMRHAPGADVRVELEYAPAELDLRVVNGPPG